MGEYLKMADVFKVGVSDAGIKVRQNYIVEGVDDSFKPMEYAAHAINSHDELVAEAERLRGALQDAYLDGCHAGWDMSGDGYNAEYGGPEDGAMHDMFVTKSIEYMK
ncbi:MAG: hypothetical protein ACRDBQ_22115 [Shewanella sp.]